MPHGKVRRVMPVTIGIVAWLYEGMEVGKMTGLDVTNMEDNTQKHSHEEQHNLNTRKQREKSKELLTSLESYMEEHATRVNQQFEALENYLKELESKDVSLNEVMNGLLDELNGALWRELRWER